MAKTFALKSSSSLPSALIAGAAGFIGSHLCDALIHQNCKVYAIDNWSTGKKDNIAHLLDNKKFVFLEHDINHPFKSPLPRLDYVFHLAGIEAYTNGLDVSLETLLVNSLGTKQLLEIAKKHKAKYLLASTADIFSGFISDTSVDKYFGQDHSKEEKYSHHEAKRFSEALTFEYLNRDNINTRIVRLDLVYGPRMDLKTGNDFAKLFSAVKSNQSLKIPGNGLKPLRPVYISDIIYGLTKAMFSQSSAGQIFTLVNPESITLLNLAYKFKEILKAKKLDIKFVSGPDQLGPASLSDKILNSQKNLGWIPKINLEQGINKTLNSLGTNSSSNSKQPLPEIFEQEKISLDSLGIKPAPSPISPAKTKPKLSLPKLSFKFKPKLSLPKPSLKIKLPSKVKIALIIFVLLITPIFFSTGIFALSVYSSFQNLNNAAKLTDFSQINQAEKLTQNAYQGFSRSRTMLRQLQPVAKIIGLSSLTANLDRLLFIGSQLSQGALYLAKAGEAGTFITQIVFHHSDGNINEALKQVQINLDQAFNKFSFVESELQSGHQLASDFTVSLNSKIQKLTAALPNIRQQINQTRLILPIIPSFIAQDSKKTYLLLFQNSAEIRPTGGFIGSYGLLTFDKGKLLDFTVEDIYSADGQLKGYVKPPEPIKKYLGQDLWFFRDSNWDPDFSIAAQQSEWFLRKTTNRNVDGVIAVNLPLAKELLKATGPIVLSDYNEEITTDNLFERAEYHSEIDFFPGSTQKKDFLGSLAREIFDFIKNGSSTDLLKFAQALEIGLRQKQLLVYLHDLSAQKVLVEQNWAGMIYDPVFPSNSFQSPSVIDYTYLVEANLGINKANYFLKRNIQQQLTIFKTKELIVTTTINYNNQSPADAWPGGTYRSYLRHYIPSNAELISIKVGDSDLDIDKDVDYSFQSNKKVIGFSVTVPVKNSLDVKIVYRLPEKLKFIENQSPAGGKQTRLAVIIPKQPGTLADNLEVIVNHPSFLTPIFTQPKAFSSPQVVTFQSNLEQDRIFIIDFLEK